MDIDYVAISEPFWMNPNYQVINIKFNNGEERCMEYGKFKMEAKLKRKLEENERVVNGELTTLKEIEMQRKQKLAKRAMLRALRKK